MSLLRKTRGSATVDTILMFPVLFGTFLTFTQASWLSLASVATEHAANEAARAASVILADDPRYYGGVRVGAPVGERLAAITKAARVPLRVSAEEPDVTVEILGATAFESGDQVRVRVTFRYQCVIPFGKNVLCGLGGTRTLVREAVMPYQGAAYAFR